MPDRLRKDNLLKNQEFQSALVRLGIWLFAVTYIGLGAASNYYAVDETQYFQLFTVYFVIFITIFASIFFRREWEARQFFSLVIDVTAISLCIIMTKEAINPFYLLYVWLFISYGARFGKRHLIAASLLSFLAYFIALIYLDQWDTSAFEVVFFLLLLLLLPLYQHSLLQKLHLARQDAEQANSAKSAFLSTMTHELRTPLNGIVGMAQLLRSSPLNNDQKEYVESITGAAGLLNTLIGNVLDLTRIESSQLEINRVSFELRPLVREICVGLSGRAVDKGLDIFCRIDDRVPIQVEGDPLRVEQLLFNLIGNAVKFTQSGHVEVSVTRAEPCKTLPMPHLLIEVIDTGIGIASQQLQLVFDTFWQTDSTTTSHYDGTGLGTAIARSLAEIMGGEIGVDSKQGEGSRFWCRLPLIAPGEEASSFQVTGLSGLKGLVVEKNHVVNEMITGMCAVMGIECRSVTQIPQLALQIADAGEIGVLDFALISDTPEGLDAKRLSDLIRSHLGSEVPVVFLGYADRRIHDQMPNTAFLAKPVTSEVLAESIKRVVSAPVNGHVKTDARGSVASAVTLRVLLVEDNPLNAKVLGTLLSELGCEVAWAKDGEEAMNVVGGNRFDLAFVDLRMPRLDGIGFTRQFGQKRRMAVICQLLR